MGARGQVVVPVEIRRKMKLKEGSKLVFMLHKNGTLIAMKSSRFKKAISGISKNIKKIKELL